MTVMTVMTTNSVHEPFGAQKPQPRTVFYPTAASRLFDLARNGG